jgi:hypothetical protein
MSTQTATVVTRVIKTLIVGETSQVSIFWEGTNIEALSRQFPPSTVLFADQLGIRLDLDGGLVRTYFRFEQQATDGSWYEIDDPRVRVTPMTSMERAIDDDNRRQFPGDFITVDCERCGDHGCPECDTEKFYCDNCRDYGCMACEPHRYTPEKTCGYCSRYFPEDELNSNGDCSQCESYRIEDAQPRCSTCYVAVEQNGQTCPSCKAACIACNQSVSDRKLKSGEICMSCELYYARWNISNSFVRVRLPRKLKRVLAKDPRKWTPRERIMFNRFVRFAHGLPD